MTEKTECSSVQRHRDLRGQLGIITHQRDIGFQAAAIRQSEDVAEQVGGNFLAGDLVALRMGDGAVDVIILVIEGKGGSITDPKYFFTSSGCF